MVWPSFNLTLRLFGILLREHAFIAEFIFPHSPRVSHTLASLHRDVATLTQACCLSLVFGNCSVEKNVSCPDSAVVHDHAAPSFPWSPLLCCFGSSKPPPPCPLVFLFLLPHRHVHPVFFCYDLHPETGLSLLALTWQIAAISLLLEVNLSQSLPCEKCLIPPIGAPMSMNLHRQKP